MTCFELSGREKPSGSKVLLLFRSMLLPSDKKCINFRNHGNPMFGLLFLLSQGNWLSPEPYRILQFTD